MVEELKGIDGSGGGGIPQKGGRRSRGPVTPAPSRNDPSTVPGDAAALATGAAGKARAMAETLEGLQRALLALPEADPGRGALQQRLSETQVTLSNLLAIPTPSGPLSAEHVLALLGEPR